MKNLQVLPKDMPQPQVVAIMRAFNAALGVECGHCHVWTKPGDPSNDMAADTKIEKTVARVMMQMTNEINTKLAASIKKPADQIARVECATCHRGAAIPVTPPPPPRLPRSGGTAGEIIVSTRRHGARTHEFLSWKRISVLSPCLRVSPC